MTAAGAEASRHPPIIDSPAAVRRINRARVLEVIRLEGPVTRPEVVQMTGLSKVTVREVCDGLLTDGLVDERPPDVERPRGPGRPASRLAFRADLGHVLGIDVGADKVLVLMSDLGGDVVASHRVDLEADRRPRCDEVLSAVDEAVEAVLERAGGDRGSLRVAVAGTPGVVDPDTGVISLAPQIDGWDGTPLARELEQRLPCQVLAENEVQLAVVGERWRGAAYDLDAVVYLQLGIGVAAGIVVRGELHRGSVGGAGEIGYLPVPGAAEPPDGYGAFEWSAGGRAFARHGEEAARGREGARLLALAGGDAAHVDARVVFAAAAEGDRAALAIVAEIADRIAYGVATLACVLNPALIVVGGGLSNAGIMLLDPVRECVERLVPLPPPIVLSRLGERAVALGALRMALEAAHAQLDVPHVS